MEDVNIDRLKDNVEFLQKINNFIISEVPKGLDLDESDKSYYTFPNKDISINIDGIETQIRCDSDFLLALYNMVNFQVDRIIYEYENENEDEED